MHKPAPETPSDSPLTAEAARRLLLGDDSRGVVDRLARLAARSTRAPVATLVVSQGDQLLIVSGVGVPEPWAAAGQLPLDATVCRHVLRSGETVAVDDAARHPLGRAVAPLEYFPRAAYCGTPIMVAGTAVAVLSVASTAPRRWREDDVALIRDLAATLLRDLELLAGRERAALAASVPPQDARPAAPGGREGRYSRLFEESPMPFFIMAPDSTLIETNRACATLLGRSQDELEGMRLSELATDADAFARVLAGLHEQGGAVDTEVQLTRGDGAEVVCVISAAAHCARAVGAPDTSDTADALDTTGVVYHGALRDITVQKRAEAELLRTAFHDPLTGLPNRVVFMDRLERVLTHTRRRPDHGFAVLFLDLDNFKHVNDTHGHQVGDQLLVTVARRLESCVREEDTVARFGGDEFALLLDMIHDVNGVTLVVDRIRDALAAPFTADGRGTYASIGIAICLNNYDRADDLLRDADAAMYRAKEAGSNGYVIYDEDMHSRALAQRQLEDDLREAVTGDQLAVHYHPVVRLDNGSVEGLEALVRWTHPSRGILLPAEFMPLAEQTGLVVELGWWVLREACRQLRAWQIDYPHAAFRLTMSVNLSARQFVHPQLVDRIDAILAETGLDASCLRLDLTEAVVMNNADLATTLLRQLRDRGIRICIDDFGTGHSSVSQLREFAVSTLKIDRSFIQRLKEGGEGREIVQTIIALGNSMAIDSIAEGVETPEQLDQLRRLGTRFAQGFLFSLPLDGQAAAALLSEAAPR